MKKYLLLMIAAAVLLWSPGRSTAFDAGSWIRHGVMALDSRADAESRKESNKKGSFSGNNRNSAMSRLKKYFRSGRK